MKTTITNRDLTLILGIAIGCIVIVLMMFREPDAALSHQNPVQSISTQLLGDLTKLHVPFTSAIQTLL